MGRGGHGPPERQGQPCSRAPWGCWASLSRPDSTLGGHFCVSKHRSASQAAAVLHAPDNKAGPCGSAWGRQRTALPTSPQKATREEARPAGKGAARASWQPELWRGPSPWLSPRRALCGRRTCARALATGPQRRRALDRGTRTWRERWPVPCASATCHGYRVPEVSLALGLEKSLLPSQFRYQQTEVQRATELEKAYGSS